MSLHLKRTHNCGALRGKNQGESIVLAGWVHRRRDHGGVIFIDLRDREGLTQIVINPDTDKTSHEISKDIRNEYVLICKGKVEFRPEGTINKNLDTGEIEIAVTSIEILNKSNPLPFNINEREEVSETLRLKYRYIDLRRPELKNKMVLRHKVTKVVRDYLDSETFLEVETPFLTKSTPEGARDYLVPSRINPGEFYALPQSPQIFKQVLMISGFERYFQIARCFRDEDLRADRQPEFTQIDMEMSFVDRDDIFRVSEEMMSKIFSTAVNKQPTLPFPALTYDEAMRRFGCDKPDMRFGLELEDITPIAEESGFKVFTGAVKSGGEVRGFNAKGCAGYSRKDMDDLTEEAKIYGSKGLAWFKVKEEGIESPIAKFFSPDQLNAIKGQLKGEPGDLLVFVADNKKVVAASLAHLRLLLGERLELIDEEALSFVWITDFPVFDWDSDAKRWNAMHHPFTAPVEEDLDLFEKDPGKMRAIAYDLVLNGSEIGGGSLRIHKPEIQEKMFKTLGIEEEEAREKFGFFLDALGYGTPPHGGIAFGLDRIMAILTKSKSIRDVIPFPKTQKAVCLMTSAPSGVGRRQLRELHIKAEKTAEKKDGQ